MQVIENIRKLKIDTSSFVAASRDVTEVYKMHSKQEYEDLILDLVMQPLSPTSLKEAELLFGYLVQETVRLFNAGVSIEKDEAIALARAKTADFMLRNPWLDQVVIEAKEAANLAAGIHTKAISIKRGSGGSKKDKCIALYRSNATMDRKQYIELFVAQLGLSVPGATTYVYNCMKGIWK